MSEEDATPNTRRVFGHHPVQVADSRSAKVGPLTVRRALPTRGRRMVGAWCFADHMGPETLSAEKTVDIAPTHTRVYKP